MQAEDIRAPERGADQKPPASEPAEGFFQRLFSLLAGGDDPEKERRRLLKDIAKQLKGSRFKFYKPKTGEALPGMAKFFYEMYAALGPAQVLVDHAESSGVLKTIIIENTLSPEQIELKNYVSEESIRSRSQMMEMKELATDLKEKMITFFALFDAAKSKEINAVYNLLSVFLDLVHFDYYFILKKFDANLPERDFKYQPRFDQINGEYVVDDLKEFLTVLYLIDPAAGWDFLFGVLNDYRKVDVVSRQGWQKLMRTIVDIRRSHVLEYIVRYADRDPHYKVKVVPISENIVEEYLNKLKSQAELAIQKISREKQNRKVQELTQTVFGTTAVARTKNYTEKTNTLFTQRMLGGFLYVAPLNFLKAFLLDYFKKDIREIVDLLLVRGRWSTPLLSQQLSESYHVLLQVSDELLSFDESLGEDAEMGTRIRNMMHKIDRDKTVAKTLRQILKEINDAALAMIQKAAQSLVVMGKNLKIVLDDRSKSTHELIVNWKEIDSASDGKIQSKIVEAYKKIYYFIQLLQMYARKEA